ncbi:MAG: glycerate kinase [Hadesarchaea archaeon]|nr:glycerate kinase [Hadesarchaea archaeon]
MKIKNKNELIENARNSELKRARKVLVEIVEEAIESADPSKVIHKKLSFKEEKLRVGTQEFDFTNFNRVIVIGGGKASGKMAEALEELLGNTITKGVINVPGGTATKHDTEIIKLIEAGHPLPNEGSLDGAEQIMDLVSDLGSGDLVICLLSGGGSALITLPVEGVSLEELQKTTQLLLESGASIQEVNAVRKHLSRIKGGQLARAIHPAESVTLIISDVVGDRLDTIASGPTYSDSTTYFDALEVIKKYSIREKIPTSVLNQLESGAKNERSETPKSEDECFSKTTHEIIASNTDAVKAAREVGESHELNVSIISRALQGEAREVGTEFVEVAKNVIEKGEPVSSPALIIAGGETTVTVSGEGKGGRNQELALSAAIGLNDLENVTITSFSTDGIDGPTDAAGAIADNFTIKKAHVSGLDPENYLENNDSYNFFNEINDLIITGPTGTNVMDVTILWIE